MMKKNDFKQQAKELMKQKASDKVSEFRKEYKLPNKDQRNES